MPPIPLVLNRRSGTADVVRAALADDPRFALHESEPADIGATVRESAAAGADRVAVAGGDGTMIAAAEQLVDGAVALAVVPGGTLNHFAGHLGIPTQPAAALDLAASGEPRLTDVGYVGERLFVNTSTVGAYVVFVRLRERLEPRLGYWLASFVAGLRLFFRLPTYRVEVEVAGAARHYDTPLVFVGVGERELQNAGFRAPATGGRPGLHVIVVHGRRRVRLLALALAAVRGGPRAAARMPEVDSFVVDRCRVTVRRPRVHVSTDGELQVMDAPLEYRVGRQRLRVVVPPGGAARDAR